MAKSLVLAWLIAGGLVGAARADDGEPRERVNRRALLVGCTDYQLANLPDLWGPVAQPAKISSRMFGICSTDRSPAIRP
jgi:hypothetical protein